MYHSMHSMHFAYFLNPPAYVICSFNYQHLRHLLLQDLLVGTSQLGPADFPKSQDTYLSSIQTRYTCAYNDHRPEGHFIVAIHNLRVTHFLVTEVGAAVLQHFTL